MICIELLSALAIALGIAGCSGEVALEAAGGRPLGTLQVAVAADRSDARPLDGAVAEGPVRVFLDAPAGRVAAVAFFLDDGPGGTPFRTADTEPFDLMGAEGASARAWDTTTLSDGRHRLVARIDPRRGPPTTVRAEFEVRNGVAPDAPATETPAPDAPSEDEEPAGPDTPTPADPPAEEPPVEEPPVEEPPIEEPPAAEPPAAEPVDEPDEEHPPAEDPAKDEPADEPADEDPRPEPGDGGSDGGSDGIWRPAPGTSWQWQLQGELDTSLDVDVYDIDLFDTSAATIEALQRDGRRVICYFSAGSYEPWRPDADAFPRSVRGESMDGWDEDWLDVRAIDALAPVMRGRLDLAARKGCDAVEPDNVDGWANDTGFPLTYDDQIAYNTFLAEEAHARGLAIGLKNDLDQIPDLVDRFDFAVNEECYRWRECEALTPFVEAGKAVFGAEYGLPASQVCPVTNALDLDFILKDLDLGPERVACR